MGMCAHEFITASETESHNVLIRRDFLTNVFLFHLQRHSDHHAWAKRRYQILRHHDIAPQLPAGYSAMIVLAMIPPLWRRVMNPRVEAYYKGEEHQLV